MTRCPECSKENNEDASFCQYCGTKFAHMETEKKIILEDNQIKSDSKEHSDLESKSAQDLIISVLVLLDTVLIGFVSSNNIICYPCKIEKFIFLIKKI